MKILLAGGAGYIGSALTRRILSETDYEFDIADPAVGMPDVREITGEGYDVVVDLAALRLKESEQRPAEAMMVNYRAAVKLAKTSKHFIFASSCSCYGMKSGEYAMENDNLDPTSVYAVSKVAAERELDKATIFRFATAYGLSTKFRPDLLVHEFINDALSKGKITLYGADFYRPICHVDDIAGAILLAIQKQPLIEVFNIGNTAHNFTKLQLAKMVQEKTDCEIEIAKSNSDPRNYKVSFEKAASFGFKINHNDVKQEIAKIVEACRDGFAKYQLV